MNHARRIVGLIGTVIMLGALAAASGPLMTHHAAGSAAMRLAFRARPERIEVCRTPTAEELARVAAHMRQEVICEGVAASYQLRLQVDDTVLIDRVVHGGGLRHDRPLQLEIEHAVMPGPRRVQLSLVRREAAATDSVQLPTTSRVAGDTGIYAGRAVREVEERTRRDLAAIPARLSLDSTISFPVQRVILVTFDPDTRAWQIHGAEP